jgi:hypothetical protein
MEMEPAGVSRSAREKAEQFTFDRRIADGAKGCELTEENGVCPCF